MSISTIVVGGNNVTLIAMPQYPGLRSVEFSIKDTVAVSTSIFTGQSQVQQWPGADLLSGTFTLPPMSRANASNWIAFLMQLRGMSYAFQLGDPLSSTPLGTPLGIPMATTANVAMSQVLATSGWTTSKNNLLLPGDYIQVGYRLHRVLDVVNSDSSGNATFSIWPSLRETLGVATSIVTTNTQGIFRLASNIRKFSFDVSRLTSVSFQFQEWR